MWFLPSEGTDALREGTDSFRTVFPPSTCWVGPPRSHAPTAQDGGEREPGEDRGNPVVTA